MIKEMGSEEARSIWDSQMRCGSSRLAYPEARAALAAAGRAGRLSGRAQEIATRELEMAFRHLRLTELDAALAREAGELAERLALRGSDAVHLASALRLGPSTLMVTWDDDLNRAARLAGLRAAPALG